MQQKLSVLEMKKLLNSETPIHIEGALNAIKMPPILSEKFLNRNRRGGR